MVCSWREHIGTGVIGESYPKKLHDAMPVVSGEQMGVAGWVWILIY